MSPEVAEQDPERIVRQCIEAGRNAMEQIQQYDQAQSDNLARAAGWAVYQEDRAESLIELVAAMNCAWLASLGGGPFGESCLGVAVVDWTEEPLFVLVANLGVWAVACLAGFGPARTGPAFVPERPYHRGLVVCANEREEVIGVVAAGVTPDEPLLAGGKCGTGDIGISTPIQSGRSTVTR